MTASAASGGMEEASYRYGVVLVVVLVLVAFAIVSPGESWSRAVGFGLEVAALLVVIATSRAAARVRGRRALMVGTIGCALLALIAARVIPLSLTFALSGLVAAAIPVTLVGGVMRLLRERGATVQAVAGALTLYLMLGLLFAWVIGFTAAVESSPYFAQTHDVTTSAATYYSFTVMTTTGFGDFTAATRVGKALAVLEMLTGQIYVVVVIGLLVGSFAGRRQARAESDAAQAKDA